MKRKFTIFYMLCLALLLYSCGTVPPVFVYDETLSKEESVHLWISSLMEVSSYNGLPVPTKSAPLNGIGFKSEWHNVILPPGETEFIYGSLIKTKSVFRGGRWVTDSYAATDLKFKYAFEPGEYTLWLDHGQGHHVVMVGELDLKGIAIYRGLTRSKSEETFVANVPLLNNRDAGQKLILE